VCREWSRARAVCFRLRPVPGRCASVLRGRVKSRTVSERNGVTLKFSCVHTVSNRRCATTRVRPAGRAAPSAAAGTRPPLAAVPPDASQRPRRRTWGPADKKIIPDFWRSILSMLEPTSRTPPPTDKMVAPPIPDGLDAVFRRKSLRRASGRASRAA